MIYKYKVQKCNKNTTPQNRGYDLWVWIKGVYECAEFHKTIMAFLSNSKVFQNHMMMEWSIKHFMGPFVSQKLKPFFHLLCSCVLGVT